VLPLGSPQGGRAEVVARTSLDLVYEILRERRRGASWMFGRAIEALGRAIEEGSLSLVADILSRHSPLLKRLSDAISSARSPREAISKLAERYRSSRLKLLEVCEGLLEGSIVTISYSSAVFNCILSNKARVERVYLLESRPGDEVFSAYLDYVEGEVRAEVVPDTYMARVVRASDFVVFGADLVDPRGKLYNKVGTYQLALVARHFFKPVVAVFESFKVVEGSLGEEVFEEVPIDLIDKIVTDLGVFRADGRHLSELSKAFYVI